MLFLQATTPTLPTINIPVNSSNIISMPVNSNTRNLKCWDMQSNINNRYISQLASSMCMPHIPLDESKLKLWPVRLRLHNLQVNLYSLQNAVWKATIHLFNLLLLFIYIPFSATLFSSCCQIYRSFYAKSVTRKKIINYK